MTSDTPAMELTSRLLAILAADAVSFSSHMADDEVATIALLETARDCFREQVDAQGGRVVDTAGDSVLAVFPTAQGAVRAALEIQAALLQNTAVANPLRFRIGLHLGDVWQRDDGSVYGDGVNVAARIQSLAAPSGVLLSDSMRSAVKGKVPAAFEDAGEHRAKNIAEPLRVFRVVAPSGTQDPFVRAREGSLDSPAASGKPSIAILPLTNLSSDPEQEYFCDGVAADIIVELSRFHTLLVIARNSSFSYKGRSVEIRSVAEQLNVRYVLEGTVQRAGNRIRLNAQLVDGHSGTHLWAEKYDREVTGFFELQEELTKKIVMSISPSIDAAERERVRRRPGSFSAYEVAVRAFEKAFEAHRRVDTKMLEDALADARASIQLDSRSVAAWVAIAFCNWQMLSLDAPVDRSAVWQEGISSSTRAIELDPNDCMGYVFKALLLAFAPQLDHANEALLNAQKAAALNPNNFASLQSLAFVEAVGGHTDQAMKRLGQLFEINPRDPLRFSVLNVASMVCFLAKKYEQGLAYAELGIDEAPAYGPLYVHQAFNCVGLGQLSRARAAFRQATTHAPRFAERALGGGLIFRVDEQRQRATEFARIAAESSE